MSPVEAILLCCRYTEVVALFSFVLSCPGGFCCCCAALHVILCHCCGQQIQGCVWLRAWQMLCILHVRPVWVIKVSHGRVQVVLDCCLGDFCKGVRNEAITPKNLPLILFHNSSNSLTSYVLNPFQWSLSYSQIFPMLFKTKLLKCFWSALCTMPYTYMYNSLTLLVELYLEILSHTELELPESNKNRSSSTPSLPPWRCINKLSSYALQDYRIRWNIGRSFIWRNAPRTAKTKYWQILLWRFVEAEINYHWSTQPLTF